MYAGNLMPTSVLLSCPLSDAVFIPHGSASLQRPCSKLYYSHILNTLFCFQLDTPPLRKTWSQNPKGIEDGWKWGIYFLGKLRFTSRLWVLKQSTNEIVPPLWELNGSQGKEPLNHPTCQELKTWPTVRDRKEVRSMTLRNKDPRWPEDHLAEGKWPLTGWVC